MVPSKEEREQGRESDRENIEKEGRVIKKRGERREGGRYIHCTYIL